MRKIRRLVRTLPVLSLLLFPRAVYAGGACCSASGGGSDRTSLTLVGASAINHEVIGGEPYELDQQALIFKLGKPIGRGFVVQAQLGSPTSTELSHQAMRLSGRGGLIYGAGLGYKLPRFLDPVELFTSVSYSRALGYLDRDGSGAIDQTFRINEFQALLLGEAALNAKLALFGGLRVYSGKNQLKDNKTGAKFNGDQEGSLAGLAGLRYSLSENLSLVADAGFGHTRVIGIGAVFLF